MGSEEKPTNLKLPEGKEVNASRVQQHFMKLLEQQNQERVRRLTIVRKRNLAIASGLGCAVFGIYFYTMYAVKQERFLDDFNEPEKTITS